MYGVLALVVPVDKDIKVIAVFGRHCDKLLVAAEIVYKGRVPVRGKGFFLFGFLIDNAAVVGRVLSLRGLCKGGDGKAARQHEGGAECGQGSKDFLIHSRCPPFLRCRGLRVLRGSPARLPCPEYRRRKA